MWSLTSPRTNRISGPRNFRSLVKKDFFNTIGQKQTNGHELKFGFVRFSPKADKRGRNSNVRFVPIMDITPHCLADTAPHYRKPLGRTD
jgi:hypothetical protein